MVTKAELNCFIVWSYTPNCTKSKSDIIDEIFDKVKYHEVGTYEYTCGVQDSPIYPFRKYLLVITQESAFLHSGNNKSYLLRDYTERPFWMPEPPKDTDVLMTYEETTQEKIREILLKHIQKAREKANREPAKFQKKDREVTFILNDVKFISSLDDDRLSFLLSVMYKNGKKKTSCLFNYMENEEFLASQMILWMNKHSEKMIEPISYFHCDNLSINKLLQEIEYDKNHVKAQYILHNRIWATYKGCLERFSIPENKTGMHLSSLSVKESFRRKGIGSHIMDEVISYADKTGKIIVLTFRNKSEVPSFVLKAFFRKYGFEDIGYTNNEHRLPLMVRTPVYIREMEGRRRALDSDSRILKATKTLKSTLEKVK